MAAVRMPWELGSVSNSAFRPLQDISYCLEQMAAIRHSRLYSAARGIAVMLILLPLALVSYVQFIAVPDLEIWLSNFFGRIDFSQFTITTLPFSVNTPSSLGIERWVRGEHQAPALAVAAARVNIEASS